MPRIASFDAGVDVPQATDRGIGTAQNAASEFDRAGRERGRAIGGAIAQVGGQFGKQQDDVNFQRAQESERHQSAQMIGHGSAVSAQLWTQLTQQWNEAASKSDPNDTSVGPGFRTKALEPSLEQFQANFAGSPEAVQKWAIQTADNMRNHFTKTISADEMTRAQSAVGQNIRDTYIGLTTAADLSPSGLADYVKQLQISKDFLVQSHALDAKGAATVDAEAKKMESGLAMAAIKGIARTNPDAAAAEIAGGKFSKYLDALQTDQMEKYVNDVKKQARIAADHDKEVAEKQRKEAQETVADSYIQNILTGKSVKGYETDSRIDRSQRENITSFLHARTIQMRENADTTPHPQNLRNIINNIDSTARTDPAGQSDKSIYAAYNKGELNIHEFQTALGIYNARDKPVERQISSSIRRVESLVGQTMDGNLMKQTDATGWDDRLNKFEIEGRRLIAEAPSPEARNKMLDPLSKDYVFSAQRFAATLPTQKEAVAAAAAAVRGPDVNDLRTTMPDMSGPDGKRPDGSAKGRGFLGPLKGKNGVMTEYSIGVPINGKETDIPSLVPTLSRREVQQVLNEEITPAITKKATAFAKQRIAEGKPVFATSDEEGGAPAARGPAVGAVQGGYRFKGGNPADKSSWEKI